MIYMNKFIECIIDGFQKNKGKASCYCFTKSIIPELINAVIKKFKLKNQNANIFIVVDKYETRQIIVECLKKNDNDNNVRILSANFINIRYNYIYPLIITVGVNDNIELIRKFNNQSKFTLTILTENIMDNEFIKNVRVLLTDINTSYLQSNIATANIYSPVEEHRYGVNISDSDLELYNKYTDYINTSINIFGDLSNIEKCKNGNPVLNISAADYRNTIAKENGWREDLDTTISYMKQIDEIYNPNVLFERACTFYNIASKRRDLVSDNDAKLEIIKNICVENKNKKILIVSKRGEFAAKITKYLNKHDDLYCGDYHDCIEDAIAVNNDGSHVLIKTGVNKGQPKIVKAQAQSTGNERLFNMGNINILSIKYSSNTKLKIACDIVILTSSLYDSIIDIKTRFRNIQFNGNITQLYKLYCNNTIESVKLLKEPNNAIIKVINETQNNIEYDENSGCIIL